MAFLTLMTVGFAAGLLAKLFVPGSRSLSWFPTLLVGVSGSLLGGFVGKLMEGRFAITYTGIFGSVAGAIVVLVVYRMTMDNQPA